MSKFVITIIPNKPDEWKPYKWLAFLLTVFFVVGCDSLEPSAFPKAQKNLVIIAIDTVRADVFFSEHIDDALSKRLSAAQQYRSASSVASWTIPAVASTLTGLYPLQHNAGLFQTQPANLSVDLPSALNESALTLAEMLDKQQFQTGAFSAHPWFSAKFGLAQGFNQLYSRKSWQLVTERYTEWLDELKQEKNEKTGEQDQRWFAYLHFMEAHEWHLKSQAKLKSRLASVDPSLKALLLADTSTTACSEENSDICRRKLVYNLAVRELRGAIAYILQDLENRDLLKNTVVMVYSDHGEEFWEHKTEHQQSTDPRGIYGYGHGQSLYEELLHVPILVWHPELKGTIRHELVSLIDIVPSALSWLGFENSSELLPGINLPTGKGQGSGKNDSRTIFASGIAYGPEGIAVREGQLKSIMRYPDEDTVYFDLSSDQGEKQPIQSDQLTMRFDVLTGDYVDMKNESFTSSPELDAKTLEHLKSIGYLQGVEEQPEPEGKNTQEKELEPDNDSGTPDSMDPPEL